MGANQNKLKVYTEAEHARRLIKILERKKGPYNFCPARKLNMSYDNKNNPTIPDIWEGGYDICILCKKFVGIHDYYNKMTCPCFFLGKMKAVKMSWLALEEKGYI